uniref:VWA domain-containing protein n=1 Tax=Aldersonia kunmingensis TaxID=408066 RepID=UPI00082FAF0B
DRFGLTVDVTASRDVDVRMEVIRRRLDFERDPSEFAAAWADEDAAVAARILGARDVVDDVLLDDDELRRIAALCASFDVDGMRADLVVARTATAHAAWRGALAVTEDDVRVAAELALPHRRRRDPFDEPGIDPEQLDEAMQDAQRHLDEQPDNEPDQGDRDGGAPAEPPSDSQEEPGNDDPDGDGGPGGGVAPGRQAGPPRQVSGAVRKLEVPGVGQGAPGRRSRSQARHGRATRATDQPGHGLHLIGTLYAAARHQRARGRTDGRIILTSNDVRGAEREGRESNLVVFVVDASGSMAARDRLSAVTGAVVALLRDAYQRRDKVAVITLRGAEAELVLPPTSSVDIAVRRLAGLRTGGKTPLGQGLLRAREVVLREQVRDPQRRAMMVLLTDGRATGGADPIGRARAAAALLAGTGATSVVVDCERGMIRLGLAAEIARNLGGICLRLDEITSDAVTGVVRLGDPRRTGRAA